MENSNSGKTAWDRVRDVARLKHLSIRTEQTYYGAANSVHCSLQDQEQFTGK